jgi:hypothetical protein
MIVLPAAASMIAGCADSRLAANNADAQAAAPYQTGYGISSSGPTTDLYTELFRNNSRDDGNPPATAPAGAVAQGTGAQPQPAVASSTVPPAPYATASNAAPQVQPAAPAAVQPEPPPPPAVPTAYGISSNGPTTDLYTEIFGPRTHN